MFCPKCKAEYRLGYTKCFDCHVDLVENLPQGSAADAPADLPDDPSAMVLIWAGADASILRSIRKALDAAKIPSMQDSVESQLMPAFQLSILRVYVRRSDYQAAVAALAGVSGAAPVVSNSSAAVLDRNSTFLKLLGVNRNLLSNNPAGGDLSADAGSDAPGSEEFAIGDDDEPESSQVPAPEYVEENFYPEDATRQVWSGDDTEMAENLKICLREVGIGCIIEDLQAKINVRVMPASEARAREIVREVVEATPPQ